MYLTNHALTHVQSLFRTYIDISKCWTFRWKDECETAAGKSAAGSNSGVISMFCPASQRKYSIDLVVQCLLCTQSSFFGSSGICIHVGLVWCGV